jgi:hypothetical protein
MLTAFRKAAKYAALNDDQLVIADDHPNIDGAMRRLNEDFARIAAPVPPTVAEQEQFDAGREYPRFDEAFGA